MEVCIAAFPRMRGKGLGPLQYLGARRDRQACNRTGLSPAIGRYGDQEKTDEYSVGRRHGRMNLKANR